MPHGTCTHDGCDSQCFCREWCSKHYQRWYKANRQTPAPCTIDGCNTPQASRGWCQMHYIRWTRHGDPLVKRHKHDGNRVDPTQRKTCLQCGAPFSPRARCSHAQWKRRRYCSKDCKVASTRKDGGRQGARRRYYDKTADWATWWEHRRRAEDRADLKTWRPKVWPHCRLGRRAEPRLFIGRHCQAHGCDATWVSYAAMPDAIYCKRCNRARWRETHYERAARHGAQFDVIDPLRIFERDNWRCQLCGRKTDKTGWPNPKRATLDHIVPLARGGDHVEQNLQCACWLCNARKGARSHDDQLRLAV